MNNSSKYIFNAAKEMGLSPELLIDYGLVLINYNGQDFYFFNSISNLNSAVASYIAKNKHATRAVLEKNNLPNIPFLMPESMNEALEFLNEHKKIMIKPTYGMNSLGVRIIKNEDDLKNLDLSDSILEKFINGEEYRCLVINGEVIAVHFCIPDLNTKKTKRINIDLNDWNQEMVEIAIKATKAIGLKFASIDFLNDENGKLYILEVNSAPGISRYYEPDEGKKVDVARFLIENTLKYKCIM